jgi:hypothetical protein
LVDEMVFNLLVANWILLMIHHPPQPS